MKVCVNCNQEFKSSAIINEKRLSLSSRKYCLDCVPYGTRGMYRGKKVFPGGRHAEREFICKVCGGAKKNRTRNKKCSACHSREIRTERKAKAIKEKGGKCKVCNYDRFTGALDFHHLGDEKKENAVSRMWLYSQKRIDEELKKCVLVCARCHREIHGNIIKPRW